MRPVLLYGDGAGDVLGRVRDRLERLRLPCWDVSVKPCGRVGTLLPDVDGLALKFARCRIVLRSPIDAEVVDEPMPVEVSVEKRFLSADGGRMPSGILYDAWRLLRVYREVVPLDSSSVHVVLTGRMVVSWDEDDRRFHLRTILLAQPVVVSLPGIVHAPAGSMDFHLARWGGTGWGENWLDGEALVRVAAALVVQGLFFAEYGETFCDDPRCVLFNARRQEEVLSSLASEPPVVCDRHARLMSRVGREEKSAARA